MASAFEDPVVANANKTFGVSAYDDSKPSTSNRLPSSSLPNESGYSDTNRLIANQIGDSIAVNVTQVSDDFSKQTAAQRDQNPKPETPNWCVRVFYWMPIRWFAFVGGCLLIVLCVFEVIKSPTFADFLVSLYLVFFGGITIVIESPTFILTRKMQLSIFFWFRLSARTFGRAWFYLFIAIICFFENVTLSYIIGVYLFIVTIAMFIYSRFAALKYVRIYNFIASGGEGGDLKQKFDAKFNELDLDRDGKIGSAEIVKVAAQAGRTLSNAERHAIQTFLDESCNGSVSKEDWWQQFSTFNNKQKFL